MKKDDAVVERVRQARRAIAARLSCDKHRMLEWAKQIEAMHQGRVLGYERQNRDKKP